MTSRYRRFKTAHICHKLEYYYLSYKKYNLLYYLDMAFNIRTYKLGLLAWSSYWEAPNVKNSNQIHLLTIENQTWNFKALMTFLVHEKGNDIKRDYLRM